VFNHSFQIFVGSGSSRVPGGTKHRRERRAAAKARNHANKAMRQIVLPSFPVKPRFGHQDRGPPDHQKPSS